jgi:hypothetical protein
MHVLVSGFVFKVSIVLSDLLNATSKKYKEIAVYIFYSTEGCVARGIDTSFGASAEKLTRAIPFAEGGVPELL